MFTARGWLCTMLNTSLGGSDADNGTRDSCETGGCVKFSDCKESVHCGDSGKC